MDDMDVNLRLYVNRIDCSAKHDRSLQIAATELWVNATDDTTTPIAVPRRHVTTTLHILNILIFLNLYLTLHYN